jgi:serine/threonine protein kinase
VAREFHDVNNGKPPSYWDDTLPDAVQWGDLSGYSVIRQVGRGKYGEAYECCATADAAQPDASRCCIKIMRPVKEHRLRREIKILRHVRGGPNIVELQGVLRDTDTKVGARAVQLLDTGSVRPPAYPPHPAHPNLQWQRHTMAGCLLIRMLLPDAAAWLPVLQRFCELKALAVGEVA